MQPSSPLFVRHARVRRVSMRVIDVFLKAVSRLLQLVHTVGRRRPGELSSRDLKTYFRQVLEIKRVGTERCLDSCFGKSVALPRAQKSS